MPCIRRQIALQLQKQCINYDAVEQLNFVNSSPLFNRPMPKNAIQLSSDSEYEESFAMHERKPALPLKELSNLEIKKSRSNISPQKWDDLDASLRVLQGGMFCVFCCQMKQVLHM